MNSHRFIEEENAKLKERIKQLESHLNKADVKKGKCMDRIRVLEEALKYIDDLEKRSDDHVGVVDHAHTKALRSACRKAREALSSVEE